MSAGIDILMAQRTIDWLDAAGLENRAFVATTGKVTTAGSFCGSAVLWNPVGSGVVLYVDNVGYICTTGTVFAELAHITADPGFPYQSVLSRHLGAPNPATPQAMVEVQPNDATLAPAPSTVSTTLVAMGIGQYVWQGPERHRVIHPGNGLRLYVPNTVATTFVVSFGWFEY